MTLSASLRAISFLSFLVLVPAARAQTVHVVDASNGPGTTFADLGDAVNAAESGDILLVRSGTYTDSLLLGARSLSVTAEVGATVVVPAIRIDGLAAGDTLVVRGIRARNPVTLVPQAGISCQDSQGAIWLEDCVAEYDPFVRSSAGGVEVTDCANVVVTRLTAHGRLTFGSFADTFLAARSTLRLYDSSIAGASPVALAGLDGKSALVVTDGVVFASGCTLAGGEGDDGGFSCPAGDGGHGLVLAGTAPRVDAVDCALSGGTGGLGGCGPGSNGVPGLPVLVLAGTFNASSVPARSLQIGSPVRDDESLVATYQGVAGDGIYVRYALGAGPGTNLPRLIGPFLLGLPSFQSFRGTLGSSGMLTESIPLGDLGPGVQGLRFFGQALFVNGARNEIVAGAPASVVVLDASF